MTTLARPRTRTRLAIALGATIAVFLPSARSDAQAPPDAPAGTDNVSDAAALYQQGATLLRDDKPAEALPVLEASLARLPSANTELLVAHSLRLLERRVEAMSRYEHVVEIAGARVRAGDERYGPALADAGRWVAILKNALGSLEISVHAVTAPEILIDGRPIATPYDGTARMARARMWHEPGNVVVVVRDRGGATRTETTTIAPGGTRIVQLDLAPGPAPPPDPGPGPPLASWVAFGVGAAGFAAFAIFGALTSSIYADLEKCKPSCDEEKADEGARDQTIANVAVVVGTVGVATGAAIWIGSVVSRPGPQSAKVPQPAAGIAIGAGRLEVRGRF